MNVKIYKVTVTGAYAMWEQGTRYSLSPWGADTSYYKGYDDGGVDYILPDGYTVGKNDAGEPMICDVCGRGCELLTRSGAPALSSYDSPIPVRLTRANG